MDNITNQAINKTEAQSANHEFDLEQWKLQKQQEIEDAFQQLNAITLTVIQDPDKFKAYLDLQAQMPPMSVSNTLLILAQTDKPVTQLASYSNWKDRGRTVRRGEIGLKVLSSVPYKRSDESEGTSFKVSRAFDISQTQGPELEKQLDQAIERPALIRAMVEHSPVEMVINDAVPPEIGAQFDPEKNKIEVRNDLPDDIAVAVLAREMTLAALIFLKSSGSREESDWVSSCTTYLISKHYGQETAAFDPSVVQEFQWPEKPAEIRAILNQVRQTFNLLRHRIDQGLEHPEQETTRPARKHIEHER
jgi:hypothetical protein